MHVIKLILIKLTFPDYPFIPGLTVTIYNLML